MRFKLKKGIVAILLLATIVGQAPFLYNKPPQAKAQLFGVTLTTIMGNWYDIGKDIAIGAALRIAQNYVNQSLTRYLNQVTSKYKIRNYLYYDQVLTSNYLLNYLRDKVEDPETRRLLMAVQREMITIDNSSYSPAQRRSLTLRLKADLDNMYKNQTGIDPALITNPPADMTTEDYLLNAQSFFFNPPSNFDNRVITQLTVLAAQAHEASQQEIAAGQGNKSSRAPLTSNVPTTNSNGEQTFLQIREAIENPGGFVKDFTQEIMAGLVANNWVSDNPYTRIGAAVGDFLWTKLALGPGGSSVYNEYSYNYIGQEFDIPGNEPDGSEVDIDNDGFPDYLPDSSGNRCFHGTDPFHPSGCKGSATVGSSAYFNTLCRALAAANSSATNYLAFITANRDNIFGDQFKEEGYADVWGRKTLELSNAVDTLQNSLDAYKTEKFDQIMLYLSPYARFINEMGMSMVADGDLDLGGFIGIGNGGGGINNLISNTQEFEQYIIGLRRDFGAQCDTNNVNQALTAPPPNFTGLGGCTINASYRGNDLGAPTQTPDPDEINFTQGHGVENWAETSTLNSIFANNSSISYPYDRANGGWPPVDIDDGNGTTMAQGNVWIIIWRNGGWVATTFDLIAPGQTASSISTVFCAGSNGSGTIGDFAPVAGETYGFMVSGIAENMSFNNVRERTNIVMYTWPPGITGSGAGGGTGGGGTGGGGTHACSDPGNTVANYTSALRSALNAVIASNPNGIADMPNNTANSRQFLAYTAVELRNAGYEATERVINGNGNQGSGDLIAVWRDGDSLMERYDAIAGVNDGSILRDSTRTGFTGDIPLSCVF